MTLKGPFQLKILSFYDYIFSFHHIAGKKSVLEASLRACIWSFLEIYAFMLPFIWLQVHSRTEIASVCLCLTSTWLPLVIPYS